MHPGRLGLNNVAMAAEIAEGQTQNAADKRENLGCRSVANSLDHNRIGRGGDERQAPEASAQWEMPENEKMFVSAAKAF